MIKLSAWTTAKLPRVKLQDMIYGTRYLAELGRHECFTRSMDAWELTEDFFRIETGRMIDELRDGRKL